MGVLLPLLMMARKAAGGGGGPITATYQTQTSSGTDASSYSFTSQPIGTAAAGRRVVVSIGYASASAVTLSSVTIGGVSASIDGDTDAITGNRRAYIVSAVVPTGTTATVAVTLSGTAARVGIGVWSLSGGSPTGQTATSINSNSGTLTVTTAVNDVVICAGYASHSSGTVTTTWTDATERFDASIETATNSHTGADVVATTTSTAVSYSTDITTSQRGFVAVAYA